MVPIITSSDPPNGDFPPTGRTSDLWPVMIPYYMPATQRSKSLPAFPTSRCVPATANQMETTSVSPGPTTSTATRARATYFVAKLRNPHAGTTRAIVTTPSSSSTIPSSGQLMSPPPTSARPSMTKRHRGSSSDIAVTPPCRSMRPPKPRLISDYSTVSAPMTTSTACPVSYVNGLHTRSRRAPARHTST